MTYMKYRKKSCVYTLNYCLLILSSLTLIKRVESRQFWVNRLQNVRKTFDAIASGDHTLVSHANSNTISNNNRIGYDILCKFVMQHE